MEQRLKKIVAFLAILGFVGFLANLLVDNPYTHQLIRAAINEKVKQTTHLTVDFQAMKASALPLGVDLYGLYVATDVAPRTPLVTAAHVKLRLSLWSLFLGEVRLSVVEAGDLTLVWPPPWQFAGFLKHPAPEPNGPAPVRWPPAFDLPVSRVLLTNARIYVEAPLGEERVPLKTAYADASLVGVDLDLNFLSWHEIKAELGIKSANVALGPSSMLEDTSLAATVTLDGQHFTADHLKVAGERLNFDGHAHGDLLTAPRGRFEHTSPLTRFTLAAAGHMTGDLSLLGSYLDLSDTHGPFAGDINLAYDLPIADQQAAAKLVVKGQGQVKDGRLDGYRLYDSTARFELTPDAVTFPAIDVRIGDKSYGKGSGTIRFDDPGSFDFHAAPSGLRLIDLLDALGIDFRLVDAALVSPDLHIVGTSDPLKIDVAATAQFADIQLPETPIDHGRFPRSPNCRLAVHLGVTDTRLDFDGTHGVCYHPADATTRTPKAGVPEAPADAKGVSPIDITGHIAYDKQTTLAVQLHSSGFKLALGQYFATRPLTGTASMTTDIHGPPDHVLIDTRFAAANTTIMGIPLGSVTGQTTIDGDLVKWQHIEAKPPGGGLIRVPTGSLDIATAAYQLKTQLHARDLAPADFGKAYAALMGGKTLAIGVKALDFDLTLPLYRPLAAKGQVKLALVSGTFDGEPLFDALTGTLRATSTGWASDDLRARRGSLAVTARFTHQRTPAAAVRDDIWSALGLSAKDRLTAEISTADDATEGGGQPLGAATVADMLGTLPFAGHYLKEAGISGMLSATVKAQGELDDLQGTFAGAVVRPSVFNSELSPLHFKGFFHGGQVNLVADQGGGAFAGRLAFDLTKTGIPYEWFFHLNRMDLRALGTTFFSADPRNYLYLTADWRMQGLFADWWRSKGELEIKDLRGKYVRDVAAQTRVLALKQEQPVKLLFTKEGWRFAEGRNLDLTGKDLQLRVSLDKSHPPERLGLRLESIVDVGLIKDFTQEIDTAEGKLRVVATVDGPATDPDPTVEITDLKPNPFIAASWRPVTLAIADLRPAFRNVHLRVLYRRGHLVIDTLAAEKGSGSVTASGTLNLLNTTPDQSQVDVAFTDATIIYPVAFLKSFETQVSGNLSISGQGLPFKVGGDIVINKARSTREVDIRDEIINWLREKSFTASVVAEKPTVTFDLNVSANKSINIHNRNLQSLMSADLHIKGTDIAPVVTGQVEVDKGKFSYKQDFQITRGLVTFDDPVKPDPSLDIVAVSDVDAYRVYINITGRASNPTVEFSVDPPTRETGTPISKLEILVLLSRGTLPEENRSLGQETQNVAASEAANLILGQFEQPVEKLFDLSGQNVVRNVYITTHPSAIDGSPVPQLNLPLDLGDDIDVVLRADQTSSEVSSEYKIHDNITFSGVYEMKKAGEQTTTTTTQTQTAVSDEADAKVNLKFRFSFE